MEQQKKQQHLYNSVKKGSAAHERMVVVIQLLSKS